MVVGAGLATTDGSNMSLAAVSGSKAPKPKKERRVVVPNMEK